MTKKDYEAIAKTIRTVNGEVPGVLGKTALSLLVEQLGKVFLHDNPNFDMVKFRQACRVVPVEA